MATGINMKMPERKKRRKTDGNGLTNIKKAQNTVHKRLEKKLFRKYVPSVRRVFTLNFCIYY